MARFIVNAIAGTRSASLLIIISPSDLCSVLLDAIKKRLPTVASRLSLTDTANLQISLHLNHMDGPILDLEDLLSDVFNGTEQTVYAVINVSPSDSSDNIEFVDFADPHRTFQKLRSYRTIHRVRLLTEIPFRFASSLLKLLNRALISIPSNLWPTLYHSLPR